MIISTSGIIYSGLARRLLIESLNEHDIDIFFDHVLGDNVDTKFKTLSKVLKGWMLFNNNYKLWLDRILKVVPKGTKPWDGICTLLSEATDNGEYADEWKTSLSSIYTWLGKVIDNAITADKLVYRTLYEILYFKLNKKSENDFWTLKEIV